MFTFPQTMSPAFRAHMGSQLSLFNDVSKMLFSTVQQINELHFQVAQTLLEESISGSQQLLEANDPYEAVSIAAAQVRPATEKVRAYQNQLTNIAAGTQVDLVRTAEAHVPEATRTAAALADEVARTTTEETARATQRQKAVMEKLAHPLNERGNGNAHRGSPKRH